MKRGKLLAAAVLATLALVGCEPGGSTTDPESPYIGYGLTSESFGDPPVLDTINGSGTESHLLTEARSDNQGGNTRVIFANKNTTATYDQGECITFTSQSEDTFTQQGVMLRWDGQEGIGFTKNIYMGSNHVINVHIWNTNKPVDGPAGNKRFDQIGSYAMSGLAWSTLPWRMCARITGTFAEVHVWPLSVAEPNWDDPAYNYKLSTTLDHPGIQATYIGHLQPGQNATFDDPLLWGSN